MGHGGPRPICMYRPIDSSVCVANFANKHIDTSWTRVLCVFVLAAWMAATNIQHSFFNLFVASALSSLWGQIRVMLCNITRKLSQMCVCVSRLEEDVVWKYCFNLLARTWNIYIVYMRRRLCVTHNVYVYVWRGMSYSTHFGTIDSYMIWLAKDFVISE